MPYFNNEEYTGAIVNIPFHLLYCYVVYKSVFTIYRIKMKILCKRAFIQKSLSVNVSTIVLQGVIEHSVLFKK